jgi:chromosomal replication initiator protein
MKTIQELTKKAEFLNSQAYMMPSFKDKKSMETKLDVLLGTVAEEFELSLDDLKTKSRKQEVVLPRQIIEFLLVTRYDYELTQAGEVLGLNRHHTTVIHSRKVIRDYCDTDPSFREWMSSLIYKIKKNEFRK